MKKAFVATLAVAFFALTACEKDVKDDIPADLPRTQVSAELQGAWMYGHFSMTEYWSTDPSTYVGNALQFAFAFQFNADGTYTQYFTASSVQSGGTTYQQSVTKGTVEVNEITKTIRTHPYTSHYKRTRNGQTVEERDMSKSEIAGVTNYTYTTGVETSGTKALYLTLQGTSDPLTFLKQ